MIIALAYLPPSSPVELYEAFCTSVSTAVLEYWDENSEVLMCGDFNLPGVSWISDEYGSMPVGPLTRHTITLSDCAAFFNLRQFNFIANCNGSKQN